MSPRIKYLGPGLWIELDGDNGWFAPGETVRGTIHRSGPMTATRVRVFITLHGSSECQVSLDEERTTKMETYTSYFDLFDPELLEQVIFEGLVDTQRGGEHAAWPFSFIIPQVADRTALSDSEDGDVSYTLFEWNDQPLPDSFAFGRQTPTMRLETHVEYYLEATLEVYDGSGQDASATLPVHIQTPTSGPPIKDFALRSHRSDKKHRLLSHHLTHGQANAKLSLSQKLQRRLHSRSVPRLGVEYEVEAPHKIQLDNPAPVPLLVRVIPDWTRTSWDIHGVTQRIRVDSVRVRVTAGTAGLVRGHGDYFDVEVKGQAVMESFKSFKGEGVYLEVSHGNPTLDLGKLLNLGYHTGDGDLHPDFEALNISHRKHHLEWDIRVSFAGEEHEISGSQSVRILPPSCDAKRPCVVRPAARRLVARVRKGLPRVSTSLNCGDDSWMGSRGGAEKQHHIHVCGG